MKTGSSGRWAQIEIEHQPVRKDAVFGKNGGGDKSEWEVRPTPKGAVMSVSELSLAAVGW